MTVYALTDKCNLNCIFCSNEDFKAYFDPPTYRPHTTEEAKAWLKKNVPREERNITITGGEPTIRKDLPDLLRFINQEFPEATITLLTNGRLFSYPAYTAALSSIQNLEVEVALNSRLPLVHDTLTEVKGSYVQTVQGILNLLGSHIKTHLRYIIMADNVAEADDFSRWICHSFPGLGKVVFIYPRVRGKARMNRARLFVPFDEVIVNIKDAPPILMEAGIDVQFLHFPFCVLPERFWSKTLKNPYKKEMERCLSCSMEHDCPGVSASYIRLFNEEGFNPIVGGARR